MYALSLARRERETTLVGCVCVPVACVYGSEVQLSVVSGKGEEIVMLPMMAAEV